MASPKDKEEHVRELTSVLDAAIATGIPPGDLPPLLCAVAGMLLGEMCAKKGTVADMDTGLMLVSLSMRVTAKMAARMGNRDDVLRELRVPRAPL